VADKPIRPIIVVEAIPIEVERGQTISISARLFDQHSMQPQEVSRIFMTITSMKDGTIVWPLEVVRKDATGFDIMIGTKDMKGDQSYLLRVSNNWNLSPSASTTFTVLKKKTVLPIIPIIALIPLILPEDDLRLVEEYIFRTQMDHRVCPICKPFENLVFQPEDTNIPIIPLHMNCRCTMDVIFVNPGQLTAQMRKAARIAILMDKTKIPRQAIKVINSQYY